MISNMLYNQHIKGPTAYMFMGPMLVEARNYNNNRCSVVYKVKKVSVTEIRMSTTYNTTSAKSTYIDIKY